MKVLLVPQAIDCGSLVLCLCWKMFCDAGTSCFFLSTVHVATVVERKAVRKEHGSNNGEGMRKMKGRKKTNNFPKEW